MNKRESYMDTKTGHLRPIVCPVLIGRTAYLEALVRLMEQAYSGNGQTVLIAGVAGIGKSRLVAEAITRSHAAQLPIATPLPLTLEGHCYEPDRSLPYASILDLLRSSLGSYTPNDISAALGPSAPLLVKLLPELVTLVPDVVPSSEPISELEKRRLFQSLALFFMRLSIAQPLLVVVEDVHWSDETSLEFLLYFARRITSHRILLMLTYRSEEVDPVLTSFLAGLDRTRLTTELTLNHLSSEEVEAMIRTIFLLPHAVNANFLTPIYRLTEGNPFFIEEILKSLVTAGEIVYTEGRWERKLLRDATAGEAFFSEPVHLPRSVQLAVQQRLDHLSAEARNLLSLAAVTGQRFDFTLLQQVERRDEAELVPLVKELISAQLVVEEAEDVFAFRHALTRQAVYTDLLSRERRALHLLVAETLERIYAETLDAHLDDLSYHFYAAKSWAKVLEYAPRAGEKAQALYVSHAAIEQFTHALEAAKHLAKTPSHRLYRARGQCYELLGDFAAACLDYTRSLDAVRAAQDSTGEWQSLFDLGYLWTGRDYEEAGNYLHRALEVARTMGDALVLARTLNRIGNWHMNLEEPVVGQQYHLEALSIFRASFDQHDEHGLAETLDFLGVASLMSGDLFASARYYEQAIAHWRTLDDRQGLISSLVFFAGRGNLYFTTTVVSLSSSGAECIRDAEEAVTLARQLGSRSDEAFARIFLGLCLGPRGEYGRALSSAETGLNIAIEIEHGPWMATGYVVLGIISLELLELPTAQQHLERALTLATECGSLFLLRDATAFLAAACIAQGNFARAKEVLDDVFGVETPCQTLAQRLAWYTRAEFELALGQPDKALAIIERLMATATNVEDGTVIPRLGYLRGEALIALGRMEEAESVLCSTRDAAQRQGARPLLWRIGVILGNFYRTQSQREEAEEAFALARTTIEELASTVADHDLRTTFLRHASAQLPPAPAGRKAIRQAFGGLTEREREVALLIAQGKTSRAIADELIVSERTIEKHVERIMSRLGFTSRTQIATWVIEKGLKV